MTVAELERAAERIFAEEIARAGGEAADARASALDACSVAVVGDQRRYGRVVALRASRRQGAAAPDAARGASAWVSLPASALDRAAARIVNELDDVSRVVYDVSAAPSGPDVGSPSGPDVASPPSATPQSGRSGGGFSSAQRDAVEGAFRGVLIVDFGSQYTRLLARRVRELEVFCEIVPPSVDAGRVAEFAPEAVILSGGPGSAHVDGARMPEALSGLAVPMLGVCYGMQLMAASLGGAVERAERAEYGAAEIRMRRCALFGRCASDTSRVWMSHGDRVSAPPPGFEVVASTDNAPVAALADERRRWYGVQFHPEVRHTPEGSAMLKAFLFDIARCRAGWTAERFADVETAAIRRRVAAREHVVLALSGGVDSAVAACLAHRAIGDRLHCVFVDNGLLREGEADRAIRALDALALRVERVDAAERFLSALAGISDPERKRRAVGETFVRVFEARAGELDAALPATDAVRWLAQGTIYPDVIESGAAGHGASLIKSHHNVGGLPARMGLRLLEPLRWLFKDEVRALGARLGLPDELLRRHPFPGPGLAVRVLGEVTVDALRIARRADAIFMRALRRWRVGVDGPSCHDAVAQALVALLPGRADGADPGADGAPDYRGAAALRAVVTDDFMTASASWGHLPEALIGEVAARILDEVPEIGRVVYDLTGKPPATVEWE